MGLGSSANGARRQRPRGQSRSSFTTGTRRIPTAHCPDGGRAGRLRRRPDARPWSAPRTFYGETLGLRAEPELDRDDWIEFETGNVTLALVTPEAHDCEFAPLPLGSIALRVPDVEAAKEKLEAAGVEFRRRLWDSGVCNGAAFDDPDGNGIAPPPPLRAVSRRIAALMQVEHVDFVVRPRRRTSRGRSSSTRTCSAWRSRPRASTTSSSRPARSPSTSSTRRASGSRSRRSPAGIALAGA